MLRLVPGSESDLEKFHESHKGRLGVDINTLRFALSGWKVWRLEDKKPIAVIVTKDGAAHIAAYEGSHVGIPRMRWALDALKIKTTTVSQAFKPGHILARRLGFFLDRIENKVAHYVRIPY